MKSKTQSNANYMFYSSKPANINTYTIDVQNKVFCQPANKKTILESDRCLANNSN